ncbi:hypothetical protein HMPREF0005_05201, partial [Achromobacter xylosoxidans C54]
GLPGLARAGLVAPPQAGLAQPLPGHRIGGIEGERGAQVRFGIAKALLFGVGLAQRESQQHVVGALGQHGFQTIDHFPHGRPPLRRLR